MSRQVLTLRPKTAQPLTGAKRPQPIPQPKGPTKAKQPAKAKAATAATAAKATPATQTLPLTKAQRRAKREATARRVLAILCERLPELFGNEAAPRPLALGIHNALHQARKAGELQGVTLQPLAETLTWWTGRREYLAQLTEGAFRFDQWGQPCGQVTATEAAVAAFKLAEREKGHAEHLARVAAQQAVRAEKIAAKQAKAAKNATVATGEAARRENRG